MLSTTALTLGQITFIIRAIIQILSHGGMFLIGIIILASAPRLASLKTHDAINRAVGKSTFTKSSLTWVLASLRGKTGDPARPTKLVVSILLVTLYGLFSALSDIGFLGLRACELPGPTIFDRPSSVNSTDAARNAVLNATIPGSTLEEIQVRRCSTASLTDMGEGITENLCSSWENSTYADSAFFTSLNSTDSDMLMPRNLRHYRHERSDMFDLNSYFMGPSSQRVENPVIRNGVAIFPGSQGVVAIFGVPSLLPLHSVNIDHAMALEIEMGCMSTGVFSIHDLDDLSFSVDQDMMDTNATWSDHYFGPDYMQDTLTQAAEEIRALYRPSFNESSLNQGWLFNNDGNATNAARATAANILSTSAFPLEFDAFDPVMGNCTNRLRERLNLTEWYDNSVDTCNLLGLGGTMLSDDDVNVGYSRMMCATATQINLVSATISTDVDGAVFLNYSRLPSDLHHTRADYFDVVANEESNTTQYNQFEPYERFTLAPNPNGPTSHFITQNRDPSSMRSYGLGSGGGDAMTRAGSLMIDQGHEIGDNFASLSFLSEGQTPIGFRNGSLLTKWGGQVGASFILQSLAYNGWAAVNSPEIMINSTGGMLGTCYDAPYAAGFVPLLVSALLIILWILYLLVTSHLGGSNDVEYLYGGLTPFWGVVSPHTRAEDTLLSWVNKPKTHLELIHPGQPLMSEGDMTAARYIRSGSAF